MNRRSFIRSAGATSSALFWAHSIHAADAATAAEQAHAELWRRFIDRHGVMIDFAPMDGSVSLPTPEECRAAKPNALGWWSPIENGPMFNGLYMDVSRIIAETIQVGLLKPADPHSRSKRHAKYLSFWA